MCPSDKHDILYRVFYGLFSFIYGSFGDEGDVVGWTLIL